MKQSALFFDIDGTLLSEVTGRIPESALRALEEARKNGHLVFINTGRTVCSLPEEIKQMKADGFLCGCGTYIEHQGEVLFEVHPDGKRAEEIAKKAAECKVDAVYEGKEDVYFPSRISRFDSLENTRRYMNNRGLGRERYIEQGNCSYDKLFAYVDEESDETAFFDFIAEDMEPLDRGNGTYECILKGYTKATAIAFILEKFGMEREQAYVFGDSSNDLAMFEYVPHAVAMGKHDKVLDAYTEYITDTVEKDGIVKALRNYGLVDEK